jgi:NAD(P)-dependent dehydrogenase (short-subunit alcohol dehydrogenase family)
MSTFVLVHGSWHDASAWKPVIDQLEAKGHLAFAPTIAGHGKGVDKNVNHARCTQSIVDYILDKDLTDIVLLGHSFGGTIIAKVAEVIGDRTESNWLSSLTAMLYGGITEEILMRWGLMSLLVWIAWKVLKHANAVLFLSSEMASFVTGETLMVDGGAVAQ